MKRTHQFCFRISDAEMKRLRRKAKKAKVSMANYIRLACGLFEWSR